MSDHKTTLLRMLAQLGVTEQDYNDIERAKAIIHEVNLRLWERHASTRYAVSSTSGPPNILWAEWDVDAVRRMIPGDNESP